MLDQGDEIGQSAGQRHLADAATAAHKLIEHEALLQTALAIVSMLEPSEERLADAHRLTEQFKATEIEAALDRSDPSVVETIKAQLAAESKDALKLQRQLYKELRRPRSARG
jgi:hypothetical protein